MVPVSRIERLTLLVNRRSKRLPAQEHEQDKDQEMAADWSEVIRVPIPVGSEDQPKKHQYPVSDCECHKFMQ